MDVVLLSESGQPIGRAQKDAVHGTVTPLHLAFSCHLFDADGRVLITRRSLTKLTWPGVWTNSFCGHPRPDEPPLEALYRHASHELGAELERVQLELPHFRYTAVDASGVMENEICPVYTARLVGSLSPNPDEVMEHAWVDPDDLAAAVRAAPSVFSPWLVLQAQQLAAYRAAVVV